MGLTGPEKTPGSTPEATPEATLPSHPAHLPARTTFAGRYVIERELGRGGMGVVLLARDDKLSRRVALKVLPGGAGEAALQRFEQEARAAGALNHPNVVAVYDIGMEGGEPYIVSEMLEGGTLRERLGGKPLSLRQSIDFAVQLARGLSAAHEREIIHRDLKPENLFVTNEGRLKILDFGIAKLPRPEGAPRTQTGAVMGTVGYMSPEQVMGEPADARSDIFSFGAIFHEMLAGVPPFDRKTPVESCYAIVHSEPPELPAPVPIEAERVVRRCLEKKPEHRYQTAHELALDVQALVGTSDTDRTPVRKRGWRSVLLASLIAAAAGAAAGALAFRQFASPALPDFHKLTFRSGRIYTARFAPGGAQVVYDASWEGGAPDTYLTTEGAPESRALGLPGARLLAVSRSGELLLQLRWRFTQEVEIGTLARVPLQASAPREIAEDVLAADWAPDGERIAVIRLVKGQRRLEFPLGYVVASRSDLDSVRVSPRGDRLAVASWSAVEILDLEGKSRARVPIQGLARVAWASDDELWISSGFGEGTRLLALGPSGRARTLASLPGAIYLEDVSGGRALVDLEMTRLHVAASAGGAPERDLAWLDESLLKDLSVDGSTVLFSDLAGKGAFVRRLDGSPAVRLTGWYAFALSPDGRKVLAQADDGALAEVPIGPGDPVRLPGAGMQEIGDARYFPDGEHLLIMGAMPGHGRRLFVRTRTSADARPISPEGMLPWRAISPDGKLVAAVESDLRTRLYPVDGGEARAIPGLGPPFVPAEFEQGGHHLTAFAVGEVPARAVRVQLDTGEVRPWRSLAPADPAGLKGIFGLWLTPDGKTYAYGYRRSLSELVMVGGLR